MEYVTIYISCPSTYHIVDTPNRSRRWMCVCLCCTFWMKCLCCCCCFCCCYYCSQCTLVEHIIFTSTWIQLEPENVNGRVNKTRWHIWKSTERGEVYTKLVTFSMLSCVCWLCVCLCYHRSSSSSLFASVQFHCRCDCGWARAALTHNFQLFQIVVDDSGMVTVVVGIPYWTQFHTDSTPKPYINE